MHGVLVVLCILVVNVATAQEDLLKELEENQPEGTDYSFQTFK